MVVRGLVLTALLLMIKTETCKSMLLLTANIEDLRNLADTFLPRELSRDLMKLLTEFANIKAKSRTVEREHEIQAAQYRQISDKAFNSHKNNYKIYKKYHPKPINLKTGKIVKPKTYNEPPPEEDKLKLVKLIQFDKHKKSVKKAVYPQVDVDINWRKLKEDLAAADKELLKARKNFIPSPTNSKRRLYHDLKSKYLNTAPYQRAKDDEDCTKTSAYERVTYDNKIASSGPLILTKKPMEDAWWEKKLDTK